METIITYLENMFKNLPTSKEVKKAKEELLSMMEDKYNELKEEGMTENEAIGTVISEFGNLDELADELGILNYMNKTEELDNSITVTFNEAKEYISDTINSALKIAIGVVLCICSPILLITMEGIADENIFNINENVATFVGTAVMFIFIAIAVGLFIINALKVDKYDYLETDIFNLEGETESYIKKEKEIFKPKFASGITIGVILCVLSVIPVMAAYMLFKDSTLISIMSIVLLLIMVSIAVFIFITTCMRYNCYKVLLQEDEYEKVKKENKLIDKIAAIYWPIIVCIYLIQSFVTMNWWRTWIIWPIAGIVFGVIASICNIIQSNKK